MAAAQLVLLLLPFPPEPDGFCSRRLLPFWGRTRNEEKPRRGRGRVVEVGLVGGNCELLAAWERNGRMGVGTGEEDETRGI